MQLTLRQAAKLLSVSEKTIHRWLDERELPASRLDGQLRFNRTELLEWATVNKVRVSPEIFEEGEGESPLPSFSEALSGGGIIYDLPGSDKESVLRGIVASLPMSDEADRELLFRVMLAREALGSTGIGDGIAIPHVRNPIVLSVKRPAITLCFLQSPIDFEAIDGQPVHTLFSLTSPTVKTHLHLLSRLAYALRDPEFKATIVRKAPPDEILAAARRVEARLSSR